MAAVGGGLVGAAGPPPAGRPVESGRRRDQQTDSDDESKQSPERGRSPGLQVKAAERVVPVGVVVATMIFAVISGGVDVVRTVLDTLGPEVILSGLGGAGFRNVPLGGVALAHRRRLSHEVGAFRPVAN
jgi:hypothetical protein